METKVHRKKSKSSQKTKHKKNLAMVPNGDDASDNGDIGKDELHSLTHYAGDEEILVDHMFAAIQGTKLEAMMPPVLKAIPLQDLKVLCVHELRGISKKRIVAIIQGRDMSDSSGSSDDEDSGSEDDKRSTRKKRDGDPSRRHDRRGKSKTGAQEGDDGKPMDIVELEMRARLIQTMLKGDPKHKGSVDPSDLSAVGLKIKNEPKSPRGSRSRSYSTSGSRSHSQSYSRSRSRSGSSYSSGSEDGRKRGSKRRSRRHHHRRRRGHGSSSKKREASKERAVASATPDRGEDGDAAKKRQARKTKISRKEFEDRMKKAKENRTYRKRKDSEDEEKRSKEDEVPPERPHHVRESRVKKEKTDVEEGEESEKEEGEIDSNEEEGSYYSDEKAKSRKGRHRSRSRSSYSSLSSSGNKRSSSKKKGKRSRDKKRSARGDVKMPVDKKLILATLNEGRLSDQGKGDPGKAKPGIETVDSEEDFDCLSGAPSRSVKLEPGTNMVPRTDRTNVSFSFNKKSQPALAHGTDLEFGRSTGPRPSSGIKPPPSRGADQIVISSDSEGEAKTSKHRRSDKVGSRGNITDGAVILDDDTNTTHNTSDQNDLKLCEATVMKDIFADIDDDEDDDVTRIEVKRELIQESNLMEIDGHESQVDNYTSNNSPRSPHHLQVNLESSANISIDKVNESDVYVKQEFVSPSREENHPPPNIIKSEPWDDLGIPDQRELATGSKSHTKKGKKGKSKKKILGGKRRTTEGLLDSSLEEVGARTVVEKVTVDKSFTQSRCASNDSEEGACTDQEAELNNSLLTENKNNANSSNVSHDPLTSSPVHNDENIEDTAPETSAVDSSNRDSTFEKSPRTSRTASPTLPSHTCNEKAPECTESNLDDPDLSEEESGLVDLPEDEHFEVEEDDDDNSRDIPKYDASALEILHRELNDDEGNVDNNDFYRGADGLNFSKENSRAGVEEDETTLASIPDNQGNTSDAEEGEVANEEASEDGGLVELVELQPEEAEELTALAETALPLPRQGNTEIIGEIDPSMMEQEAGAQALGDSGSSWSSRWLQSEKVQKVVSSNKMLNRMRKRIIKNDKLNAAKASPTAVVDPSVAATTDVPSALPSQYVDATSDVKSAEPESVPVIGSMEEYQKMLAEQESAALPQDERVDDSAAAAAAEPAQNSSEDSEEDDLWSKMMGS